MRFTLQVLRKVALLLALAPNVFFADSITEIIENQEDCIGVWGAGEIEINYLQKKPPIPNFESSELSPSTVDMIKLGFVSNSNLEYSQDSNGNKRIVIEEQRVVGENETEYMYQIYYVGGKTIIDYGDGLNATVSSGDSTEKIAMMNNYLNLLSPIPFHFQSRADSNRTKTLENIEWEDIQYFEEEDYKFLVARDALKQRNVNIRYTGNPCLYPVEASFVSDNGNIQDWNYEYQEVDGFLFLDTAFAVYAQKKDQELIQEKMTIAVKVTVDKTPAAIISPPEFLPGKIVSDLDTSLLYEVDNNGILQPFRRITKEGVEVLDYQ